MLRSLKQARYAAEPLGHFALAFDEYTHFTSPIRRYPDLIVHRVLKWALAHPHDAAPAAAKPAPDAEAVVYSHGELEAMATETSEAERRADGAERELMDWKTAQFMEAASRRGVRRADHFRAEVRLLRRADRDFRRRTGAHQRPGRSRGEPLRLSRAAITPSSPCPAEMLAAVGAGSSAAAAQNPSNSRGSTATASASAPNASTPCVAASNSPLLKERDVRMLRRLWTPWLAPEWR